MALKSQSQKIYINLLAVVEVTAKKAHIFSEFIS